MVNKNSKLQEEVVRCIANALSVPHQEIKPSKHLFHDLGGDSLSIVKLVMSLENALPVAFSQEEIEKMQTVEAILAIVHEKAG